MTLARWSRCGRRTAAAALPAVVFAWLSVGLTAQAGVPPAGGATTVADDGPTAFGRALANLDRLRWSEFRAGKQRFTQPWPERGPWTDAAACSDCHHRDGRGPAPENAELMHLLRLTGPGGMGDPAYGRQLRRVGHGVPAPGRFTVEWEMHRERYASGEWFELRRPIVRVGPLAYGPLHADTRVSLRVPPAVFGLGLLEAVPEAALVAMADPDDADGDGISGRPRYVRDGEHGRQVAGRFGWKAGQVSLPAQAATALAIDLGVANPLVREERRDPSLPAADTMADESGITALAGYLRALAVPARRRAAEPVVREGEALFSSLGCSSCHRPQLATGVVPGWPELSGQAFAPYTDLLLHDMGPGLADEIGDEGASAREWRTPPLWGLGLLAAVNGSAVFLHDGRARSLEEAVLWHGGEAERSRRRFVGLPREKRQALLVFLSTL